MPFNQPKPNSESLGYKPEQGDELSDQELQALLHKCGVRVAPQSRPQNKRVVDLDHLFKQ